MRNFLFGVLLLVACDVFAVEAGLGVAPGALPVIAGKLTLWPIPMALAPRDPVPDSNGRIIFVLAKGDRVVSFDPRTVQFNSWALQEGTHPHGVALGRNGKVFFAGKNCGILGELDTRTGVVRQYPTFSAKTGPYSVLADSRGNVWMTERSGGRLAKFNPNNNTMTEYPMDGEPYGLAIDRGGFVWVSRLTADTVTRFDPGTATSTEVFTGIGSRPRRLAMGPDGFLWVTLYGTGKVIKIDTSTVRVVKEYPMPEGSNSGPYSVNVDALGRVWITAFQKDSVVILDPKDEKFRIVRIPQKNAGIRSASLDAQGRYWFICSATGQLGMIE